MKLRHLTQAYTPASRELEVHRARQERNLEQRFLPCEKLQPTGNQKAPPCSLQATGTRRR